LKSEHDQRNNNGCDQDEKDNQTNEDLPERTSSSEEQKRFDEERSEEITVLLETKKKWRESVPCQR
jgi:hypothetical protein